MEQKCVNTKAEITAAGHWEPKGFVVKPQNTRGTKIDFDPHCGIQVCRAKGQAKL